MITSKAIGIAVAVTLMAVGPVALAQMNGPASSGGLAGTKVVDSKGNLRVPENYRTLYQVLGSWAVAADNRQGSKEIHEVYASPGAIDGYRTTGRFLDGTVLVKEVFRTSTSNMTTGDCQPRG